QTVPTDRRTRRVPGRALPRGRHRSARGRRPGAEPACPGPHRGRGGRPMIASELPAVRDRTPTAFERAVAELRAAVGSAFVQADAATRAHGPRSTLPQGTTPAAVVRPSCAGEVQEIVRIAGRHRLALYPLSCGKNWGYSDACAALDGQVILDLRRMNHIIEV